MQEKIKGSPTKQRNVLLDALRGFALLGIAMANFPEFSLWTFQSEDTLSAMPSAGADHIVLWMVTILVEGKFYTIFSVLFGIGFSLIISNALRKGADGFRIFYRRMVLLTIIGLLHLLFLWSGDILLLYALMGMLLPLFRHCSDRALLRWAFFFLLLPVGISFFREMTEFSLARHAYNAWWNCCDYVGITEENFGTWLRDAHTYGDMLLFLVQGAVERMWEFISGNRYFKVLGLFLIGYYIGRRRLFEHLDYHRHLLVQTARIGFFAGFPLSVVYAWSSIQGQPLGETIHSLLYLVSVYPLGLAYLSGLSLLYLRTRQAAIWQGLANPGRMALTNYLLQSFIGVLLFYGIGLGWGASTSLWLTELIVVIVFLTQMLFSFLWFRRFLFGPLEWLWRMMTYGKRFPLKK